MGKIKAGLLLLLLPFSALSEPLLTCQPEDALSTYLGPAVGFVVLCIIFTRITYELFPESPRARVSKWRCFFVIAGNAVVLWQGILLASYTLHLKPDHKPVVNIDALMSAPFVSKGLHYQEECLVVRQSSTDVELRCKPDAGAETVPLVEFNQAIKALEGARSLRWELLLEASQKNICRPPAPPARLFMKG